MNRPRVDWILTLPIVFFVIVSLTILSSVAPQLVRDQTIFILFGAAIYLFVSSIDYELFFSLHWISYISTLALSFITIFFGFISRGAQRWIYIGPFNIQPSEVIKPFLLITFAVIASAELKHKQISLILLGLIPMLTVYFQPDLGTTLVIFIGWASIVFSKMSMRFSVLVTLFALLISFPVVKFGLQDYQRDRLMTFIDPYQDPLGKGYHVIQSTIAVGSGELTGRGLGHGTQTQLKFLPEHHTDFIFASISEELGFVGSFTCLLMYAILFWRIYNISQTVKDAKASLFCLSAIAMLSFQTFINIGMNIGIAPVTGITLPLLSYGGSSLLSVATILGLVNSISRKAKESRTLIIR